MGRPLIKGLYIERERERNSLSAVTHYSLPIVGLIKQREDSPSHSLKRRSKSGYSLSIPQKVYLLNVLYSSYYLSCMLLESIHRC